MERVVPGFIPELALGRKVARHHMLTSGNSEPRKGPTKHQHRSRRTDVPAIPRVSNAILAQNRGSGTHTRRATTAELGLARLG
eukprot:13001901-Alexandrium_andersonii.AAC.1